MAKVNQPRGLVNGQGLLIFDSFDNEEFRGDYQGGINLIYKGFARPGSDTAERIWQISKQTYDANNNITMVQWPINVLGAVSNDYEFAWDDRTTYTYV